MSRKQTAYLFLTTLPLPFGPCLWSRPRIVPQVGVSVVVRDCWPAVPLLGVSIGTLCGRRLLPFGGKFDFLFAQTGESMGCGTTLFVVINFTRWIRGCVRDKTNILVPQGSGRGPARTPAALSPLVILVASLQNRQA